MSIFAPDFFTSRYNMKHIEEFTIPLSGNKEGASEYSFQLNKNFFQHFEDAEVIDSDVQVEMTLRKNINVFEMDFSLSGNMTVACDRCLEPMVQDISYSTKLIIKYGEKYEEIDDLVVNIGPKEDQINIASFVFEYAKLALPMQCTHAEGDCDNAMLEQMEKYERHIEDEEDTTTDSRWAALAGLKDKLE